MGHPARKGSGRRGGNPAEVRGLLERTLKRYRLEEGFERYHFVLHWPEIVGQAIADVSRPEGLRHGTLFIRVVSSVWAQEMSFYREQIIRRVRPYLAEEEELKDVVFRVGPVR